MVGAQEFDVSEMSLAEYVTMTAKGISPFIAIPVFPSKAFRHAFICVNRNSGIQEPKDLAGKRIGTPLYTQTAAIWIRGDLEDKYGVDLSGVQWIQGAVEKAGTHGDPPAPPQLLKPIEITPNTSDKSLSDMLADGDIDAILGSRMPDSVRTQPDKVGHLFPNFRDEEKRYYQEHRIHPIMHTVVIRKDIYAENKWMAQSLFKAFQAAKEWAVEQMYFSGAQKYMLPWLFDDLREIDEIFGGDPWPYGIDENRPTLEAFVKYMHQQNFIPEILAVEDLFAPIHGRVD
jgi:4,5-dihydroxyphthalate decarboxylase